MKSSWRLLILLSSIALLGGCGNGKVEAAKKEVESRLSDPSSAQYRNITTSSQGVVCGEVNAKNKMGGYTGFEMFVYNAAGYGSGVDYPKKYSSKSWDWFCTTPADQKERAEVYTRERTYD